LNKKKLFICVYCGSSQTVDQIYFDVAIDLGRKIAENGFNLVYGGGRLGLMGVVADGALEKGGAVVGVSTDFLDDREGAKQGLSQLYVVPDMHTRKKQMADIGDAFVVLPGGFGTLDEFFEILVWRQLEFHQRPIIILNINHYWDELVNLMKKIVTQKFASGQHLQLVNVASSVEEVFNILKDNLNGE
jgi:uncharacterized protein (TIGR00730 family)